MSEPQDKMQEHFKQLPDAKPPYGMDTRIQALAREQLRSQQYRGASTKRWTGALATVACAALVFFIARPLLYAPIKLESGTASTAEMASENPQAADEVRFEKAAATPTAEAEQRSSAGGGDATPQRLQEQPGQMMAPKAAKAAKAAPDIQIETIKLLGRSAAIESEVDAKNDFDDTTHATLQSMIELFEQAQEQGDSEKAQQLREEIGRLFPEHKLIDKKAD